MTTKGLILILFLLLSAVSGCGKKGPLYLPEPQKQQD
ncbi:MAG TPA: hypothetical protein EYP05_04575 [Piscirickettsiaceae bacterium]|nr:hypothetical protein [Piscirickettsiaceae bacterium]HIQ39914.1 hypothetical protein [Sulfurivirga caldicuralii]